MSGKSFSLSKGLMIIFSSESEYSFSSSLEFVELVLAPSLSFGCMISEITDGSDLIFALLNVSFIPLVDVIVEWIFE